MTRTLAYITAFFTVTFGLAPFVTEPFMGFRADQLPIPQIDPPVQPAGYAFSIWGVIYTWLIVSAVFGLWKRRNDTTWSAARVALAISLALGTPWLAIANTSAIWATVVIMAMAAAAIAALVLSPKTDRWWLQTPIALYAGWLTAASFVSLGSMAAGYGILFGSLGWAYTGIAGALLVALAVQTRVPRAPEYGAAVIWALVGIIVANGMTNALVSGLAATGIALIAATLLRSMLKPAATA
jgi:hypothetical protein